MFLKRRSVMYCLFSFLCVSNANRVEVLTSHGKLSGKSYRTLVLKTEYYGFMGIPYAAPPVKQFRFLVRILALCLFWILN